MLTKQFLQLCDEIGTDKIHAIMLFYKDQVPLPEETEIQPGTEEEIEAIAAGNTPKDIYNPTEEELAKWPEGRRIAVSQMMLNLEKCEPETANTIKKNMELYHGKNWLYTIPTTSLVSLSFTVGDYATKPADFWVKNYNWQRIEPLVWGSMMYGPALTMGAIGGAGAAAAPTGLKAAKNYLALRQMENIPQEYATTLRLLRENPSWIRGSGEALSQAQGFLPRETWFGKGTMPAIEQARILFPESTYARIAKTAAEPLPELTYGIEVGMPSTSVGQNATLIPKSVAEHFGLSEQQRVFDPTKETYEQVIERVTGGRGAVGPGTTSIRLAPAGQQYYGQSPTFNPGTTSYNAAIAQLMRSDPNMSEAEMTRKAILMMQGRPASAPLTTRIGRTLVADPAWRTLTPAQKAEYYRLGMRDPSLLRRGAWQIQAAGQKLGTTTPGLGGNIGGYSYPAANISRTGQGITSGLTRFGQGVSNVSTKIENAVLGSQLVQTLMASPVLTAATPAAMVVGAGLAQAATGRMLAPSWSNYLQESGQEWRQYTPGLWAPMPNEMTDPATFQAAASILPEIGEGLENIINTFSQPAEEGSLLHIEPEEFYGPYIQEQIELAKKLKKMPSTPSLPRIFGP